MPFDQAIGEFMKQGLGYLISVIEAFVILFFIKRVDAKDKVVENRDQIIQTLQEKRVQDYKDNSEKILTVSNALLSGMQSLKEAAQSQTNAITKMLENLQERRV